MIQHLVNVSGGKDSTALYLLAIESGRPFSAVFADTGHEHELTYEFIARLPERTGGPPIRTVRADFSRQLRQHREYLLREWPKEGIPQDVVDAAAALHEPTGIPYLDLCVSKGRFPSNKAAFCTSELKELPIRLQVVLPMLKAGPVVQWLGQRAEESRRRAGLPHFNRDETGCLLWRPILGWKLEQVWGMHRRHGLAPNPLYAAGMGRVGCMPCINARKAEVRAIADRFPAHIDRVAEWERIVATANKRGASTFFPTFKDSATFIASIRTVVEWSRTGRGGRQFDLFFQQQPGSGCSSDLGLCEQSSLAGAADQLDEAA